MTNPTESEYYWVRYRKEGDKEPYEMVRRVVQENGHVSWSTNRTKFGDKEFQELYEILNRIPTPEEFEELEDRAIAVRDASASLMEGYEAMSQNSVAVQNNMRVAIEAVTRRDAIWTLIEVIKDIQGENGASREDIMKVCEERGVPLDKATDYLEVILKDGRVYEMSKSDEHSNRYHIA